MSKKSDRDEIAREICKAAKLYKEYLVGKKFAYVFDDRYIEVLYKKTNFKHLTGVECDMSADNFYRNAVKNRLQDSQIYFSNSHPFALSKRKVQHLCDIPRLAGNENFMLEEIITSTKTYKFKTTDLKFSLCMNKECDASGYEKSDCYIVESLRDEDCFSKCKNAYVVTHILSKDNTAKEYTNLLFVDKNSSVHNIPNTIVIDNTLMQEKLF